MSLIDTDTIAAVATAPGKGGVGIVRVSGPITRAIASAITKRSLTPRHAHYGPFFDAEDDVIDTGISLLFQAPNSYTGEDVLELQGHGGPVVLDMLLRSVLSLGARLARPGEFSERAFLNDKLDLTQAEAVADLIDASTEQAAKNALHSLQGSFSDTINTLVQQITDLRIYVEAAIDFPEEEIDFLSDGRVHGDLNAILNQVGEVKKQARQGIVIRDGMKVVIAGKPNAGKSSLLNALAGRDTAIVTHIEGTTRDVLREHIHIDGMPLHIIDTAGLRDSPDEVERIGIERAWQEIHSADEILMVVDSTKTNATSPAEIWPEFVAQLTDTDKLTLVLNKSDLRDLPLSVDEEQTTIKLSAKFGDGIEALKQHLKQTMGYDSTGETPFTARRRHLQALEDAEQLLQQGLEQISVHGAGELLAEDLRHAQNTLGEITGQVSADDLLGKIFSSFCIGK